MRRRELGRLARSIVLYAVGSPFAADVEESCHRLRITVAGAVKNVACAHYLLDESVLRELADLDAGLLEIPCVVPLFTPSNRYNATREATARGFTIAPALIDPTAILASSTVVGIGSYVNAGTVIGAATRIDEHVVINRSCSVGHHVEIGFMASIGPAAVLAGTVRIGRGAMIGAGAIILPKIEIGAGCVIGAGAVVTKNISPGSLAVGNPANVVRDDLPLIDGNGSAAQGHLG
jgi:sugar O-acyltransferase (sialic acid O-acetyltransferase NeuD family)